MKRPERVFEALSRMPTTGRVFCVNVGVNASHGTARSPLFADGTFEWVPIPEDARYAGPHSMRYCDLPQWHREGTLASFVPRSWAERPAHADPDFVHATYGDECQRTARAVGLRGAQPGDWLIFLSRLIPWRDGAWRTPPVFAFVGLCHVREVYHDIRSPCGHASGRLAKNAHLRRARNNPAAWDGFSVFVGGVESGRFQQACVVNKAMAEMVFRDARGDRYRWPRHRSALQVIGSYTRTCRVVLDADKPEERERWKAFWTVIDPHRRRLASAPQR